jgi:short-subunit dehydrogenase
LQPVAVVTGASSGIGEALARRLSGDGWRCVLLARREDRLERLAAELGGEAEPCDVSDRDEVERVAAAVTERHPRVKLLVNNAGIAARASFLEAEAERIERVLAVNYLGSVWCLRAFLPALEAAAPAQVVNVVSIAGVVSFPPSGPYAASKHAQLAFSRATAAQLRPRGIRVLTVNPGLVHTEGFPNRTRLRSPLVRRLVIDADDVAAATLRALARGRAEIYVPGWYRIVALGQAFAPGGSARLLSRASSRRIPREAE